MKLRVLIVEDSQAARELLGAYMEQYCEIKGAGTLREAIQVTEGGFNADLVILDAGLPDSKRGLIKLAIAAIRAVLPRAAIVAISGVDCEREAIEAGADNFIHKDVAFREAGSLQLVSYQALKKHIENPSGELRYKDFLTMAERLLKLQSDASSDDTDTDVVPRA